MPKIGEEKMNHSETPLHIQELSKKLLDESGTLKQLFAKEFDKYSFEDLRLFCHFYARYGLPSMELFDWLRKEIANKVAIEIGSGSGDLGSALGIHMTDSFMQADPFINKLYDGIKQPTINYRCDIEKIDALEAVKKYKPEVVIASWVTQYIPPNCGNIKMQGNMWGVKESQILKHVKTYIHIGAKEIHRHKKILSLPHEIYEFPWLRSRRTDNVIYVWRR